MQRNKLGSILAHASLRETLSYLVDIGCLTGTVGEKFRITVAGINEVQRRPQLYAVSSNLPSTRAGREQRYALRIHHSD